MDTSRLYYLLSTVGTDRSLPLNVPKTLIWGFGFKKWTVMETKLGVLTFRSVNFEKVSLVFTRPHRQLILKTPNQRELLTVAQISEKLRKHLKTTNDILVQEYLQCNASHKSLAVKWRAPNQLDALLKVRSLECESEAFISLGQQRPEILGVTTLVRAVLEENVSSLACVRSLRVEFVMDHRQNWRLLKLKSFKTSTEPLVTTGKLHEVPRTITTNSVKAAALQLRRRDRRRRSQRSPVLSRPRLPEDDRSSGLN